MGVAGGSEETCDMWPAELHCAVSGSHTQVVGRGGLLTATHFTCSSRCSYVHHTTLHRVGRERIAVGL